MNNITKLTKRFVDSLKQDSEKELLYWDSELKGFGLRVFSTGRKTYFIQYRNDQARTRRKKIGVHSSITAEQAREEAKRLLGLVAGGEDPSDERRTGKIKPSIENLAEQYLNLYAESNKRPKSYFDDHSMLQRIVLPHLKNMRVDLVSSRDIQALHNSLRDKPYLANRVRSLLNKMFNLARQWRWCETNPVEGVSKYQEFKRDRWLDNSELTRLWKVLDHYSYHLTSHLFKLLILTGARKGEVMNATWDQFNLEKGIWIKPSHLTKQKRSEHLPLSKKTLDVLNDIRMFEKDSAYLFPGRVAGEPIKEIKTFWKKVIKEAELQDVRIHDLRHTHASHLVSSGLSLSIVGKLLGHTQASTTQRYAHLADEPLREAAELFGTKVGNN